MNKEQQLKKTRPPKTKKCKECGEPFEYTNPFIKVCGFECAIKQGKKKHKVKQRVEKFRAVKKFRDGDIPHLTKVAQQAFNKYIRKRDEHLPCISCGHKGGLAVIWEGEEVRYVRNVNIRQRQKHAGHYRPVGRNHQHRFNEDNAHSQCSICNNHLSGNLVPYREALIKKIGLERVKALENNNETKSYSVEELTDVIAIYKQKFKDME